MGSAPQTGSTPTEDLAADGSSNSASALGAEPATPGEGSPDRARPARRHRRLLAGGALIILIAALAAVVLANSGSPSHKAGAGGVPAGDTTTTVTRRTLSESATVDGTLAYGSSLELYDRLSGTYTWLPSVGAVVARGGTLWRIDNLPIVLMYGPVPAYRTLEEGVSSGPDVHELNENLIALGFDPYGAITDEEVFGDATTDAVKRFQHANGLPETGKLELGRVVFAPSARRVTAVHVQLGQDPSGAPAGEPSPGSSSEPSGGHKPSAKSPSHHSPSTKPEHSPSTRSPSHHSPSTKPKHSPSTRSPSKHHSPKHSLSTKSPSDDAPSSKSPSGGSDGNESEPGSAPAEAVLSTTPTQQLVQLKLKPSQQQLVHTGQTAPVTLPSGSVVPGRVIEVGSVATETTKGDEGSPGGGGESESATIPVTLALERRVAHLDEAPVSVELLKAVRREVLAVPATALTAVAGGGYAIEALENGRRVQLPVTVGMFADSYVQVEGAGVREGLTVLESE